jgi:hypothetical protein
MTRPFVATVKDLLQWILLGICAFHSVLPLSAVASHSVASYGVVFDGKRSATCSMLSGSAVLNCQEAVFARGDVGKTISVKNAAATNLSLITTIAGFVDTKHVRLATAATQDTGAHQSATWGTDNRANLQKAVTASAGGTLLIPSLQRFLVKVSGDANAPSIVVPSNTAIRGDATHTIYFVGVKGAADGDWGANLFTIADGSMNISFTGLHVVGEDVPYTFAGLNQSSVIYGVGATPTSIRNIETSNNVVEYLYGFSFHNAGTGTNWNVRNNRFNYVAKGLNVNANWSKQSGNQFWYGGGLESSGDHLEVSGNQFHQAGLQYVISLGGHTTPKSPCEGIQASNNTIEMPSGLTGAISAGDCVQKSSIAYNQVSGISADEFGVVMSYQGYNAVADNTVSHNSFSGTGGYACIYTAGSDTRNNLFDFNRCDAGFAFGEEFSGGGPETSRTNWLKGSVVDQLANTEPNIRTFKDQLMGTGTRQANAQYGGSFADGPADASSVSSWSVGAGPTLLNAGDPRNRAAVSGSDYRAGFAANRAGSVLTSWTVPFSGNRQVGFSASPDKASVAVFELQSAIEFDTITGVVAVPDPALFHHYGFSISTMQGELVCSMQSGIPLPAVGPVHFGCSQGSVRLASGAYAIAWAGDANVARVVGAGLLMTLYYGREVDAPLTNGAIADKLPAMSPSFGAVGEMPVFQLHLSANSKSTIAEVVGNR